MDVHSNIMQLRRLHFRQYIILQKQKQKRNIHHFFMYKRHHVSHDQCKGRNPQLTGNW